MTSPSQPPSPSLPADDARRQGEALAWLRSERSAPPGFSPAVQAAEVLAAWVRGGADLEAVEARCLAGDSAAARALATVHATALALGRSGLAVRSAGAGPGARRSLRERLMRTATAALEARAARTGAAPATPLAPVVAIARRHVGRPEESARDAVIAGLGADMRTGDALLEQVLDRVATLVDFPLLVVSVVHGGETVHRAIRCRVPSPDGDGYLAAPRVVPREASFCTHCVADGAPLVIQDAAADPFFHRHPAVAAFGLVSYCGVPLRVQTSRGAPGEDEPTAIVGTLCGYDVRPRGLAVEDVALLEIYARRVAAVLEGRSEDPDQVDLRSTAAAGVDVLAAPMFHDLLEVDLLRASAGRPTALLVGSALDVIPAAVSLGDHPLGDAMVAGRLSDGRAAWLLAAWSSARAGEVAAALAARTGAPVGHALFSPERVASAEDARCSVAHWVERAAPRS